jgi:succinate dehydrogenase / fumarate reductase, cytochrome b subunit
MNTERPVYLSFTQFKWPLAAIASITHRITGILLFAGMAFLIWLLGLALQSPAGFDQATGVLEGGLAKVVMLVVLAALAYHLFAGIKHLVMDFHYWDSLRAGQISSATVFVLTGIMTILAGVWLW